MEEGLQVVFEGRWLELVVRPPRIGHEVYR
jgi:hypothetical protein